MMLRFVERIAYLYIVFVVISLSSCVTQKKKDDLSAVGKLYHNTTAHYNGYWNANELYRQNILAIHQNHFDNYTKVLPLYPESSPEAAKTSAESMDIAIDKLSVVIHLHRTSKWADDAYLLIGKSQFMKRDFQKAKETFEYLVEEFDPDNLESNNRKNTAAKSQQAEKKTRSKAVKERNKKKSSKEKTQTQRDKQKQRAQEIKDRKKAAKKNSRKKTPRTREELAELRKQRQQQAATKKTETAVTEVKPTTPITPAAPKKEDEKKEENDGLFSHIPAYYEGVVWLARTYAQQGYFLNALNLFQMLEGKSGVPEEVKKEMYKAQAESYLIQQDTSKAIQALVQAVEWCQDKKEKARLAFISGQLQNISRQFTPARTSFEEVLANKGNYEMDFNTKLQLAVLDLRTGAKGESESMKLIDRMIRDDKNAEYRDQLYYTLALLALEKNREKEAIEHLKNAVAQTSNNPVRKAESYLLLANLLYDSESYISAKTYYDTTLQVLPQTDERYEPTQKLAQSLVEIAKNLELIQLQDSLIAISYLSEQDKRKLAMRIKKEREEQAALAAANEETSSNNSSNTRLGTAQMGTRLSAAASSGSSQARSSSFFAYNEKELKRGYREFRSEWGGRALEDNWRRSIRSDATLETGSDEEVIAEADSGELINKDEVSEILKDVPRNAQEVTRAKGLINTARFNLGRSFRDQLSHYTKSAEYFETLLADDPQSNHKEDSYYYLYLDYLDLNDRSQAQKYYDLILAEMPDSKYAMALQNPSYYQDQVDQDKKVYSYYDETYGLFTSGDFAQAKTRVVQANELFKVNPIKAKFALLNAFCIGKIDGKEAYINALRDLVANYPNTPEQTHAKELLRILYGGRAVPNMASSGITRFKTDDDKLHFMLVILYDMEGKTVNAARNSVSDFNRRFYKSKALRSSNLYLDSAKKTPILVIRDFPDKRGAMAYYRVIQQQLDKFLPDYKPEILPATQNNYRELFRSKKVEEYKEFVTAEYLSGQ